MSTKTTFKRIALVAVAALGLGVISVVPSSAVVGNLTVTATAGSAGNKAGTVQDTTTAATISVSALMGTLYDSVTVSITRKSFPSGNDSVKAHLALADTTTATTSTVKQAGGSALTAKSNRFYSNSTSYDSTTGFTTGVSTAYVLYATTSAGYVGATFGEHRSLFHSKRMPTGRE